MADQDGWYRASWHVDGAASHGAASDEAASDVGAMFAVVRGGESVLDEPRAS